MPYKQNLAKATALKAELDSFRPLSPEIEKRIMQKFRLDWNYNSSHIEGNQLTYGETKALILFGQTAQAKPLKDHLEMTGHDEAVKVIEEVVRQERPLTESFIRELHTLILKEPYERPAQTPDGISTVRRIAVGQYKTSPNHVLTKTGEMFYFASPEETPAKMEELMNWYNENLNNEETNAVLFATEFHYKFIRIHPFDDGNGRMARLLMNLILMQKGYPPAIIKSEDKEEYYNALQQADAGQIEYFFNYLCIQVIRSLELMIKGAKGEDFDDNDDLDKKLALLKKKLVEEKISLESKRDNQKSEFISIYHNWLKYFIERYITTTQKFNEFFEKGNHNISLQNIHETITFSNESVVDVISKFQESLTKNTFSFIGNDLKYEIILRTEFEYLSGRLSYFMSLIKIEFTDTDIKIEFDGIEILKKSVDETLSKEEIDSIINQFGNKTFKFIEARI